MSSEISYASNFDVRQELNAGAERGDSDYKDESQVHEALITRSARRATRVINGKLQKAYPDQVPYGASGDVPLLLRSIANDLSVYYVRRAKHPGPGPMADNVKEEYLTEPMALLDQIAAGDMHLDELDAATGNVEVYDTNAGHMPIFDIDPIENQFPDQDRLDEIADARADL